MNNPFFYSFLIIYASILEASKGGPKIQMNLMSPYFDEGFSPFSNNDSNPSIYSPSTYLFSFIGNQAQLSLESYLNTTETNGK